MSDYIFTLKEGATCWKNSMQHLVANFVCDIEFFAVFDGGKKIIWLWKFISKLRVALSVDGLVLMYW